MQEASFRHKLLAGACMVMAGAMAAASGGTPTGAPTWTEQEITAPGPQGPLAGSWMQPASPSTQVPLALILPGSGPTDRNGNGPYLQTNTYQLLAQGLVRAGIASVRVDKRGLFGSQRAIADANAVVMSDYVADVAQWTQVMRQRTGHTCIWLIGHSEGGLLALAAAQQLAPSLCGLVLLATPGQRAVETLRAQFQSNPDMAPWLPQAQRIMAQLEGGQRVALEGIPAALQPLFAPAVQGFLMDLFRLDPQALIQSYQGPVLIVQGTQDLQVSPEDAQRLQQAQPRALLQWLPGASHTLKPVQGTERAANVQTYQQPLLALHPALVPAIAQFLRRTP